MRLSLSPSVVLLAMLFAAPITNAIPAFDSIIGLSSRQEDMTSIASKGRLPAQPPGPLTFSGTKLVNDPAHPWKPLRKGDIRGPCPGLNTLASHGYLPRNGVATPAQIINAVQEGFNMNNQAARTTTYNAHLVNGNLVTDLLSIGAKTRLTGPDPGPPALVGGLNQHGTFEGDASTTRSDAFFGDNFSFNQTLFDQVKEYSDRFGNGYYNYTVAGELRWQLIQQSIVTNPEFSFVGLRHITAYAESSFPVDFFVDGRRTGFDRGQLDMNSAESFFKDMRFPKDFHRSASPVGGDGVGEIFAAHPTQPGRNVGGVNNYVVDESLGGILDPCKFYTEFVNQTVRRQYPNPTGILKRNLKINLGFLYDSSGFAEIGCPEVFPYGTD